jgi:hypothetical protein
VLQGSFWYIKRLAHDFRGDFGGDFNRLSRVSNLGMGCVSLNISMSTCLYRSGDSGGDLGGD